MVSWQRTISAGVLIMAMLGRSAEAGECPAPITTRVFSQQISLGDAAFADMDDRAFLEARVGVLSLLPCLSEGLNSNQVASFHRLLALGAFMDGDHAGSVGYFRSVLAVAPGYLLPETLAPSGHPLRIHFEVASGAHPGPGIPLAAPRDGWIHIDGHLAQSVPPDRPYVFQYFDGTGMVSQTRLIGAGAMPPDYGARSGRYKTRDRSTGSSSSSKSGSVGEPLPSGLPTPAPMPERRPVQVSRPLVVMAGVAATTSAGMYLGATINSSRFWDASTPPWELDEIRRRSNTLGWLSFGTGFVAIGAGTAAVLMGTW